jgi:hypothetical protein
MKPIAWLLAPVLLSAVSLYAGDMGKEADMSGALCNSPSVAQNEGPAARNQNSAEGNAASVDDQGRTLKIAKQDKACKKAKAKSKPVKDKQNTDFVIDNQYMGG